MDIIHTCKDILSDIKIGGENINGTREITNKLIVIKRDNIESYPKESLLTSQWYNEMINPWKDRLDLEHDHYEFLKSFIIHKIGEVRYFHKEQDLTSRKFVIWSNDCIASIQFLHRPEQNKNILNIFIRSSDALNLLPADLLAGWYILDSILDRFNLDKNRDDEITYLITSCHYYLKDENKIDKILEDTY
jgi:hypothetical protein